jgi:hypothetical protein
MHHLTPRAPPICRKDHPCIERSAWTRRLAGGRTITLRDKLACPRKQLLAAGY